MIYSTAACCECLPSACELVGWFIVSDNNKISPLFRCIKHNNLLRCNTYEITLIMDANARYGNIILWPY